MFDFFSWSHILILLTAALVIVGPKDLPRLMHMAGRWAGKGRAMANEFRRSFDEMARQSELDELRQEIESLKKVTEDTQGQIDESVADLNRSVAETGQEAEPEAEPRSGEFQVTDAPASVAAAEPVSPFAPRPADPASADGSPVP